MAQTALITRPKPAQIESLIVDAAISEQHSFTNTVTDHPVEEGTNVADHSRPEPERVTLDCIVSNTPISGNREQVSVGNGATIVQSTAKEDPRRSANALDRLLQLRQSGALITVVTSLREYRDMAIESISIPRDAKIAGALRFTITLKRVRVVKNKQTRAVVSKDPRVGSKVKTGTQTTSTTDGKLYRKQSALDKGYEGVKDSLENGVLKGFMGAIGGG